jgi:hypothetical protein
LRSDYGRIRGKLNQDMDAFLELMRYINYLATAVNIRLKKQDCLVR